MLISLASLWTHVSLCAVVQCPPLISFKCCDVFNQILHYFSWSDYRVMPLDHSALRALQQKASSRGSYYRGCRCPLRYSWPAASADGVAVRSAKIRHSYGSTKQEVSQTDGNERNKPSSYFWKSRAMKKFHTVQRSRMINPTSQNMAMCLT